MKSEAVGERGNDLGGSGNAKITLPPPPSTDPAAEMARELMNPHLPGPVSDLPHQRFCGYGSAVPWGDSQGG